MSCPTYVAPFQAQLGQKNGGTICTAVSASRVLAEATCGKVDTTGAHIRSLTNEPIPDPKSPGLTIPQVSAVLEDHYGIYTEVHVGAHALTWEQYEAKRAQGRPAIVQLNYTVIADSMFDAGNGFRGGHAMAETTDATYDSLADGRHGVWKYDGRLYTRSVMKRAAETLVVGTAGGLPVRAQDIWCLFASDVVNETHVSIHPTKGHKTRRYASLNVSHGVITGTSQNLTGGFTALARMRCIPWPSRHLSAYCLQILSGAHKGLFVSTSWEVK